MTDREPDAKELADVSEEAEVESHSIEEDAVADAGITINFGCRAD